MGSSLSKALLNLLACDILIEIGWGMVYPIYAIYIEDIGGTIRDAGFANGLYCMMAGISAIIAGSIEDKFKRNKYFMFLSSLGLGIGFLMYPFIQNIHELYIIRAFQGICTAFFWPVFESIYADNIPKSSEAEGWSFLDASYYFSTMIGSSLSGIIASLFGVKFVFFKKSCRYNIPY
jgi:MFS family permease